MCSYKYRQAPNSAPTIPQTLSCDTPYMPDEDGRCTLLIEDHINANGPSRRIFMACALTLGSLAVLVRLRSLWLLGREGRRQMRLGGSFGSLRQLRAQAALFEIYAYTTTTLLFVDPEGYGGRLSFVVTKILWHQAAWSFVAAIFETVRMWILSRLPAQEFVAQLRKTTTIKWTLLGFYGAVAVAGPFMMVYAKPADAPLGVLNGRVTAALFVFIQLITGAILAFLAREYFALQKQLGRAVKPLASLSGLGKGPSDGVSSSRTATRSGLSRARSASLQLGSRALIPFGARSFQNGQQAAQNVRRQRSVASAAPTAAAQPLGKVTSGPIPTPISEGDLGSFEDVSRASTASTVAMRPSVTGQSAPSVHGNKTIEASAIALTDYLVAYTVSVSGLIVYVVTSVVEGLETCWTFSPPPDTQWFYWPDCVLLTGTVCLALACMRLRVRCGSTRGGEAWKAPSRAVLSSVYAKRPAKRCRQQARIALLRPAQSAQPARTIRVQTRIVPAASEPAKIFGSGTSPGESEKEGNGNAKQGALKAPPTVLAQTRPKD